MGRYAFIHHGARVLWDDPANADYGEWAEDHARTVYVVHSVNGKTSGQASGGGDTVLIYDPDGGYGEAEVPASELRPTHVDATRETLRHIRMADACLLSCIRYADARMKDAERRAREAERALAREKAVDRETRQRLRTEAAYEELREKIRDLEREVSQLRSQRDYYMSEYFVLRDPSPMRLGESADGGAAAA